MKVLEIHGFMCNGKTTLINKIKNKQKDKKVIILKDTSQYIISKFATYHNKYDRAIMITLSTYNYYSNMYKFLKDEYQDNENVLVITDRGFIDPVIFGILLKHKSLEDKLLEVIKDYYLTLNDLNLNIKHILLPDIIVENPKECLKQKKDRIKAIEEIALSRRELDYSYVELLHKYNDEYVEIFKRLAQILELPYKTLTAEKLSQL